MPRWCWTRRLHLGGCLNLQRFLAVVLTNHYFLVARNALKRKKQHEHTLEQTSGQASMLEQQIYSIESANINQETLLAMKNAGAAMKQIHGKMKMEDVDVTMYVSGVYPAPKDVHILIRRSPQRSHSPKNPIPSHPIPQS